MSSKEQVLIVEENSSPGSAGRCHDKVFTPPAFVGFLAGPGGTRLGLPLRASRVVSRLRLTELGPAVAEAFTKDEIGLGHALLPGELEPEAQKEALPSCFQEHFGQREGAQPK